jgi:predicted nicotinamide N-methyase
MTSSPHPHHNTIESLLVRDPTLFRPPPPSNHLQCGEIWKQEEEEDPVHGDDESKAVGSILFWLQLSNEHTRRLEFSCRRGSVGVLEDHERDEAPVTATTREALEALEEATYEQVDPHFFDPGYTLAGATGFQIWAGTRLLIETLVMPRETDCPRLQEIQRRLLSTTNTTNNSNIDPHQPPAKTRILELGAGIGVVGIALAATVGGAQVVLTDLPTLVDHATRGNLYANRSSNSSNNKVSPVAASEGKSPPATPDWFSTEPVLIGNHNNGWATTMALDWRIPIDQQLPLSMYSNLDFIVASDCVWLVSMLDALLDTVAAIFEACTKSSSTIPTLILSFQRRDSRCEGDDSPNFTTVHRVMRSVQARGWSMDCLAWRPVRVAATAAATSCTKGINESGTNTSTTTTTSSNCRHLPAGMDDNDKEGDPDEKEVFVFAIRPPVLVA